jgi:PKD repeat protein
MRQGYLFLILLLASFLPLHAHRGCMLKPLPLQDRLRSAHAIVEGVVGTSSTEIINDRIHTRWHIDVVRAWDLSIARPSIDVVIEGGTYQQQRLVVIPNASVQSGEHVVLMLDPFDAQTNTYTISSGPQGVMTDREGSFVDAIGTRVADMDLFAQVSAVRGRMPSFPGGGVMFSEPTMRSSKQHESTQALAVTSLSPTTFNAGTLTSLTIKGTGFGVKGANSTVRFVSADEGGEVFGTLPPFHIQSWNDTIIVVHVPCTADENPTAGTGKVRVITDGNEILTTTQSINVNWAQFTSQNTAGALVDQWSPVELVNDNGQNGYTFTLNAGLAAQNAANLAVRRALSTWRCKTGANLAVAAGTTNVACTNGADGINVITFDGAACQLPNGVLGVCYFYYAACTQGGTQYWRVDDIDLIMDGATNWQYGPAAPVAPQVDFETVALHEIGHGLGLGHVRDAAAVMYWALAAGDQRRTPLAASDSTGGRSIVNRSTVAHACGPVAMNAVGAGVCNLSAPVAAFTASVVRGCSPLTVTFTNTSTNEPANTNWDVNNDGVVDYTSTNCTHTYTTSGTYTVRMAVSNAFGNDEIIKTNLIVALSVPLVNAGPDDTVCLGSSATLGATPVATGNTPFVYRWRPGNVLNDSTIANPVATITTTTTFSVTVTDVNGCVRADTMVLTVIPRPIVNTGADTSLCQGDAKTLNAVVTSGLAPYQFQWTPAAGLNDPTIQKPIATPSTTTSYVLSVTDVRGCVQADTMKITVNPPPVVNAGPDTVNICAGGSIQLQPTIVSTALPLSYQWEPSAGLSAVNTPNPIASPISSQLYTLAVTDNNGCSKSDQLLIRVIELPKPVITTPNTGTLCEGQTVRLDAGAGFATYLWSTGATTRTIDVTTSGSYTVRVTNSFDCEGQSTPYVLTFNRTPAPQITGPSQTCVNATAVYSVTAVSGDAYVWTVTNGTIRNGAGTPTISVQWGSTGTGTVACTQTSAAGCVGTAATMNVTFGSVIVPTITVSGSTTLCDGESIELDAGVYNTYQWSTGATTRKITVNKAGSYTVTVSEPGGCTGTSAPIVVTTKPAPATPSIVRTQNTLECSVVGTAYQWSESNTPIPFATQRTYTVVTPGSYRVRVTAENACSATSEPFIVNTVGVREEEVVDAVTISPNPVTDQCVITAHGGWQGSEAIVVDARGVRRAAFVIPNGTAEFAFDTSFLDAGVYTMMVQHDGRSLRLRFVKL